jgi:hypothetical protein
MSWWWIWKTHPRWMPTVQNIPKHDAHFRKHCCCFVLFLRVPFWRELKHCFPLGRNRFFSNSQAEPSLVGLEHWLNAAILWAEARHSKWPPGPSTHHFLGVWSTPSPVWPAGTGSGWGHCPECPGRWRAGLADSVDPEKGGARSQVPEKTI